MVDLTKPSFLTPTITVKGDVVVGKPLRVSSTPSDSKPEEPEGPEITGTVLTFDESINAIDLPNNPWFPESAQGGVYNGKTYWIHRQIDLLSIFKTKFGRSPNPGETVSVVIPDDRALVGSGTGDNASGIVIKAEWPASAPINIINRGLVLGRGAQGAGQPHPDGIGVSIGYYGSTAVKNNAKTNITISNYGVIAGGGGAGAPYVTPGGGGAPWGEKGTGSNSGYTPSKPGTFTEGGAGAVSFEIYGAKGGGWGNSGNKPHKGAGLPGLPGYISEGSVKITNLEGGWSRGREGEFVSNNNNPSIFSINGEAIKGLTVTADETYDGNTYQVYRGLTLLKMFTDTFARQPKVGEKININIPTTVAIVGDQTLNGGLTIGADWPATDEINITNRGLVLGVGGQGGLGIVSANPVNGSTGISNLSSAKINVQNYGVVAGGGGGGTCAAVSTYAGGGGAPYGLRRIGGNTEYPEIDDGLAGGFVLGGKGGHGKGSGAGNTSPWFNGGAGGGWGLVGEKADSSPETPGLPGYISEGDVKITNLVSGWTRGREGYFTGDGVEPIDPEPEIPETPTINAKGHLISYGGLLGNNGYMDSSGAAIQGAHGPGGDYNVLESTEEVIITKKQANKGNIGGSPNYWELQPGGQGYRDYFNELVGNGGNGAPPRIAGTATAGGAGGGGAFVKGTIRNTTNHAIQLQAYCGKAFQESIGIEQMGTHGSLQLLISTISDNTGADVEFIYPNVDRNPTDIVIRNNETAEIWVIGAGGGAGGSDKQTTRGSDGTTGGSSTLEITSVLQSAGGGKGGTKITTKAMPLGYSSVSGVNGEGGAAVVNRTLQLPQGVKVSFDIVEDGFISAGYSTLNIPKGGAGKIIGTWGMFGEGGTPSEPMVVNATPGAGGGGSYFKAVIENASGETFTVKGVAGERGFEGVNHHIETTNTATDGVIIVRRGGISSNTSETIVAIPPSSPHYFSLANNEEMDIELIAAGGAGGSVNFMTSAARAESTGIKGAETSLAVTDQLAWDGGQYLVKSNRHLMVMGGYGGGYSEGASPGENGPEVTQYNEGDTPHGVTIVGEYSRGHFTVREDNNEIQLGAPGFTAIDGISYGKGGDSGSGNPATPGAGSSGSYFKGTIKNVSSEVFNFRAIVGAAVKVDAGGDIYKGKAGGDGVFVYKRRFNSGVDETRLVYPEDGQQDIFLPNNAQAEIWIVGGGGAFGGSTTVPNQTVGLGVLNNGEPGRDSQVVIGQNTYIAKGGAGGAGARGGSVSTSVGVGGTPSVPANPQVISGVTIKVDQSSTTPSVPPNIEKIPNPGGYGIEGIGKYGYGGSCRWDTKYQTADGYISDIFHGGSGGSGAFIKLTVNNTSGVDLPIRALAGKAGGRGTELYDIAEMAGTGIVVVKIKKL